MLASLKRFRSHPAIAIVERNVRSRLSLGPQRTLIVDDSPELDEAPPIVMEWPDGLHKPRVALVADAGPRPYWTKFRRFLEYNDIPYELYAVHESGWLQAAKEFDAIVWRVSSTPTELEEARRKIYVLEKVLGKACFPSYEAVLLYEDKILQYEMLKHKGFPVIDTFVSNDLEEARQKLADLQYPVVNKVVPGSASLGVSLLHTPWAASKFINRVFSPAGSLTYWPYVRQKDYVFFQTFEPNDGYDLRVLVVGSNVFGYYRKVPEHDFRASGMDKVEKKALPTDAMDLACLVANAFDMEMLAVDFLRRGDGSLRIIEISSFIRVDTPEQLHVDGVPGVYVLDGPSRYVFKPGRFWPQELALAEFLRRRWIEPRGALL